MARYKHIDTRPQVLAVDLAKQFYGGRFAKVETVFGNLRHNKRLIRISFTLRGKAKVDGQWKLYCMVHHIEKLTNYRSMARQ